MHRIHRRSVSNVNYRPFSSYLFVAATAGVVLLLVSAVGASANPSVQDKQAQARTILEEVQALDAQVGDAAERFNGANYELQKLTSDLAETRTDLSRALTLQKVSQRRLASRLRAIYVNGPSASAIEVILGAKNLNEVLDGIEFTQRVAAQDSSILRDAQALHIRVVKRKKQLTDARERQTVVVQQRAAEKQAIEGKLAERQRLLASVKDEIARLQEAERRRQADLQRQAQAELERQRQAAAAQEQAQLAQPASERPSATDVSSSEGDGLSGSAPSVEYTPPPADASKGAQVVAIAMQYLGIPYVWGAADPSVGFDCSGLTTYVFAKIGVSLPHYAAAQYGYGVPVSKDQLQPGDLVFFRGLGHMGMYIGGGNMIHAPHTGDVVKISPLSDPYYVANWVGARRVL